MNIDDLCYMSAHEALERFRNLSLSPVELLEALMERANLISNTVNPFADCYFEEARERAKKSEVMYVQRTAHIGPLEGIPLAVKDLCEITGKRTTAGSLINAQNICEQTSPHVERLIDAGANVFARTTIPEFAWLFTTQSRMWGVTHQPWEIGISPGGASGGSAAALGAGATTIATGSDSTGSIRQPASQCGVVGYQPPHGRIPNIGSSSFNGYAKSGPMTRTVKDCAIMANVMSGHDYRDHNSFIEPVQIELNDQNLAGMKIAFSMDLGCYEVSEDVQLETNDAVRALRNAGAKVEEVSVTWAADLIDLALGNQEVLFAAFLNETVKKHRDIVSDYVPQLCQTANSYPAEIYHQSILTAGKIWLEHLGPLFQHYDAFVMPTTAYTDIPATGWQKDTVNVNGKQYTDTDTTMAVIWNMYNRCPVMALPSGRASSGVPTGIQIIGRPHDDQTVFQIANAFEKEKPWLDCVERRPVLTPKPF